LVDECLSVELVTVAAEAGYEAHHVAHVGKAYWLPANPPGTRYQDVNVSEQPVEVMIVELQNPK
jgi:hypothetical protein